MNKYLLVFFFCFSGHLLAQNNASIIYDLFNESTTYYHSDTILGVPFLTNHNFNFLINNSFAEFSEFNKSDLILDFSDFIENKKSLSFSFFSENNLLYFCMFTHFGSYWDFPRHEKEAHRSHFRPFWVSLDAFWAHLKLPYSHSLAFGSLLWPS